MECIGLAMLTLLATLQLAGPRSRLVRAVRR